jgi:hypothetical protein
MTNQRPVPITPVGEANNRFRAEVLRGSPGHHRILSTRGIQALGSLVVQEILHQVLVFPDESFRESSDPHGDRDFIVVHHQGQKVWAKIDTFDLSMEWMSEDPADDALTVRVMTLMLPDEY